MPWQRCKKLWAYAAEGQPEPRSDHTVPFGDANQHVVYEQDEASSLWSSNAIPDQLST